MKKRKILGLIVLLSIVIAMGIYRMIALNFNEQSVVASIEKNAETNIDLNSEKPRQVIQSEVELTKKSPEIIKSPSEEEIFLELVDKKILSMSLEEKVAQLFFVTPEAIIGGGQTTKVSQAFINSYNEYPVGGIILFDYNIINPEQISEFNEALQIASLNRIELPLFIGVDEEGGQVSRIGNNPKFQVKQFENMNKVGEQNDLKIAYEVGDTIGRYLSEYGFNLTFAPVSDVYTNTENKVVKKRAFSHDPAIVTAMNREIIKGLKAHNVLATIKHFPGHGDTSGDSHNGYVYTNKTLEALRSSELEPFETAIDEGIEWVMVGHVSYPNVTEEDIVASLSYEIIQELLKDDMNFKGIVITDALNMGAITKQYASPEVSIKAIRSGVDMLLMPEDFEAAYDGLLQAILQGEIEEKRIDESLRKIIKMKLKMALKDRH